MVKAGDAEATLIFEAMAYKVAKEIGAMAAVLEGRIDAIVLTGGIAYDQTFVGWIERRVRHLAPVRVLPGRRGDDGPRRRRAARAPRRGGAPHL